MQLVKHQAASLLSVLLSSQSVSSFRSFPGIINHLWSKFEDYCDENNLKLELIAGDGYRFLNAVRKCLLYDFYEFHTMKGFQQIITQHLLENCEKYTQWHGDADKLVFDVTEFFNDRKKFNTNIVDVLVLATADALGLLIKIYRESPDLMRQGRKQQNV